jgi:hypothetical protein
MKSAIVGCLLCVFGLAPTHAGAQTQQQTRPPIQQPGSMNSPFGSDWARPLPQTGSQIQRIDQGTRPPIEQPSVRPTTPRPQGGILNN